MVVQFFKMAITRTDSSILPVYGRYIVQLRRTRQTSGSRHRNYCERRPNELSLSQIQGRYEAASHGCDKTLVLPSNI